jgi:3' terminal RNA ribose 2'-O-methyltransferase Hen1
MLLTITSTHAPATDLGFLLHKRPDRAQSFELPFGAAHVFYPEATAERCTAALLLDVDPVGLVRRRGGPSGADGLLDQYVNDRPYVASSFLSVAVARVFGSALAGRCADRPELAETPLPLMARLAALPCRGGDVLLRRLFEPLGYAVAATRHPLDPAFPDWGDSRVFSVALAATTRLRDLLTHLYVLVPVLDDDKHYWVGDDEVDKLLRHGAGWLAEHPEREQIARRYLKHQPRLTRDALARLADGADPDAEAADADAAEEELERRVSLNERRLAAVRDALRAAGGGRVLDLGCGEGKLMRLLLEDAAFTEVVGVDVSLRALEVARARLRLDRRPEGRARLLHGSLTYRDDRLGGFDAAAVVEVVEHLEPPRLAAFEKALFAAARPRVVVLTTPNAEHNVRFPGLPAGRFRHPDHRFERSRAELRAWADAVAARRGYAVSYRPSATTTRRSGRRRRWRAGCQAFAARLGVVAHSSVRAAKA